VLQNTLRNIRARRDEEEGFTLIELMVVVLIIAILIAIAIPTFLGSRGRANERAAQSSLRNAVTAAKTLFTDTSSYTGTTAAALTPIEPSLTFQAGVSTGPKIVQVVLNATPSATDVILSAQSASGKCYYIGDSSTYGTSFAMANNGGSTGCTGQTAPGVQAAAPTSGSAVTSAAAGTAPAWYTAW
jgi:type IV pilus assembly protein PilA